MIGLGPIVIEVLLESLVPAFHTIMATRAGRQTGGLLLYPLLLSIPFTTAYAVLVDRVLDVRIVVRQAVQYGLLCH